MSTQSGRLPIGVSITALSASLDTFSPSDTVYVSYGSYVSSLRRDDGVRDCDDEDDDGGFGGELDGFDGFVQK